MANIGEEIVCVWLQFCKNHFVMRNIPYREKMVGRDEKERWTNREIDILSTDGSGNCAEYEVKWRTTSWVGHSRSEKMSALIHQINNSHRRNRIKKILGESTGTPQKFLVTQRRFFGNAEKRQERIKAFRKRRIELLWFEDIINDLLIYLDTSESSGKFDPLVLKTIRELRSIYGDS